MDPEDFTIVIFLYKLYTRLYINNAEEMNQAENSVNPLSPWCVYVRQETLHVPSRMAGSGRKSCRKSFSFPHEVTYIVVSFPRV